jgi:hypothetical protein
MCPVFLGMKMEKSLKLVIKIHTTERTRYMNFGQFIVKRLNPGWSAHNLDAKCPECNLIFHFWSRLGQHYREEHDEDLWTYFLLTQK